MIEIFLIALMGGIRRGIREGEADWGGEGREVGGFISGTWVILGWAGGTRRDGWDMVQSPTWRLCLVVILMIRHLAICRPLFFSASVPWTANRPLTNSPLTSQALPSSPSTTTTTATWPPPQSSPTLPHGATAPHPLKPSSAEATASVAWSFHAASTSRVISGLFPPHIVPIATLLITPQETHRRTSVFVSLWQTVFASRQPSSARADCPC